MKITTEFLSRNNACGEQVKLFADVFPNGAQITTENLSRALAGGLSLEWFIENILPAPALEEYERVKGPAWEEYERVTGPALEEYERVKGTSAIEIIFKYRASFIIAAESGAEQGD